MHNVQLNNNGDVEKTLVNELLDASHALETALDAINKMTIHGRNYQTCENPAEALGKDQLWSKAMFDTIYQIQTDITAAAIKLQDQKKG